MSEYKIWHRLHDLLSACPVCECLLQPSAPICENCQRVRDDGSDVTDEWHEEYNKLLLEAESVKENEESERLLSVIHDYREALKQVARDRDMAERLLYYEHLDAGINRFCDEMTWAAYNEIQEQHALLCELVGALRVELRERAEAHHELETRAERAEAELSILKRLNKS